MKVQKEVLIEDSPGTSNFYEIETILKQMKKSICKIEIYEPPQKATGFFVIFLIKVKTAIKIKYKHY